MDLKDKVMIVTGSSQGIGKETGKQLVSLGAKVVFVARNKEKLKKLEEEVGTKNNLFLSLDLSIEENCKKLIILTKKKFGKIDVLINNVGRGFRGQLQFTDMATFKNIIDINLMSAVYCTKYALEELIKSKGSIVFISSTSGIRGIPCYGPYSIAKNAINAFADILNVELADKKVHVGVLMFGPVEVEKTKTVSGAKGTNKYLREMKALISLPHAAKKVIKCVRKRKSVMVVTWLSNLMFIVNRISPRFVTFLLKKFRCPEDFK
ncbi:SDR family NAD(P)-dependent oxidoreductase [archaeon]|jgi:short-subunit dehydrogenase|nr:SDR family NAD(P)-dependent oxidoreductase [archaeon]